MLTSTILITSFELNESSWYFKILCIFGCAGSSLLPVGFSLVAESGLLSSCVQASYCSGFSCCGARALGSTGFNSCSSWAQLLGLLVSTAQAL